jgi:hypothetical protein
MCPSSSPECVELNYDHLSRMGWVILAIVGALYFLAHRKLYLEQVEPFHNARFGLWPPRDNFQVNLITLKHRLVRLKDTAIVEAVTSSHRCRGSTG